MKTAVALCLIVLLSAAVACRRDDRGRKAADVNTSAVAAPKGESPDDRSEILIRHLLRRVADSDTEISNLRNEMVKRDNQRIQEEIDILEGRPARKEDPLEGIRQMQKELLDSAERRSQQSLDSEEFIELHNVMHPEAPQVDVKDILRSECGDCASERSHRALQLKQEAAENSTATDKK